MPWLEAAWHPPGWIDGDVIPFHAADRGLMLGDGVFDTSLVLDGKMVWRAAHVGRLVAACQALGFALDPARVEAAIEAVLPRMRHGSLRLTATRGAGPRGLAAPATPTPTLIAAPASLRASALFAPLKVRLAAIRRNDTSPLAGIKSLNYADGLLAAGAALRAGFDDALFLNTRGRVACTSVGNIFAVTQSELVTPPLADGAMPGIVREVLLRSAEDLGFAAVERSLAYDDLLGVDAVICTNSLRLVAQVVQLDDARIAGSRLTAALASHLARLIEAEVGVDPRRLRDL